MKISNLKIVKYVLETEIPDRNFSLLEVLKLSRDRNLKTHYIGTKVMYFPNGESEKSITLFKHSKNDYYYYDVLNSNKKCELIDNALVCCENICKNVVSLDEKVKRIRWKEGMRNDY